MGWEGHARRAEGGCLRRPSPSSWADSPARCPFPRPTARTFVSPGAYAFKGSVRPSVLRSAWCCAGIPTRWPWTFWATSWGLFAWRGCGLRHLPRRATVQPLFPPPDRYMLVPAVHRKASSSTSAGVPSQGAGRGEGGTADDGESLAGRTPDRLSCKRKPVPEPHAHTRCSRHESWPGVGPSTLPGSSRSGMLGGEHPPPPQVALAPVRPRGAVTLS